MGLFAKYGVVLQPTALGRRHGPNPVSELPERVGAAYKTGGSAAGAPLLSIPDAKLRRTIVCLLR